MSSSYTGASFSYMLEGPPESIIPFTLKRCLRFSSSHAAMSFGTISEYTLFSLILRAIRWQYWPPKSNIRIVSCFIHDQPVPHAHSRISAYAEVQKRDAFP